MGKLSQVIAIVLFLVALLSGRRLAHAPGPALRITTCQLREFHGPTSMAAQCNRRLLSFLGLALIGTIPAGPYNGTERGEIYCCAAGARCCELCPPSARSICLAAAGRRDATGEAGACGDARSAGHAPRDGDAATRNRRRTCTERNDSASGTASRRQRPPAR